MSETKNQRIKKLEAAHKELELEVEKLKKLNPDSDEIIKEKGGEIIYKKVQTNS